MIRYITDRLHNAATAAATGPWLDVRGYDVVAFRIVNSGTPVGTVSIEGSIFDDQTDAFDVTVRPNGSLDPAAELQDVTAVGYYTLHENHGLYWVRANLTVRTSGAFTIYGIRRRTR